MRKTVSAVAGLCLLLSIAPAARSVESTWEFAVQVSASVQPEPAQITLSWLQDTCNQPKSYTIFRKLPSSATWGNGTTLRGDSTTFTDNQVAPGTAYEYQVVKSNSQCNGYGYVCSGINVSMVENRGRLLLIVERTYSAQLANELARLQQDLIGDGWAVTKLEVSRTDSVVSVKNLIKAQYAADPAHVNSVFLFGHVPVPYSGDIVPDGHSPDHRGAWPCDGFYGDMEGTWTDDSVSDISAADARTHNVPGDGKYDQSSFPAPIRLMVGRVDLANLPGRHSAGGAPSFPCELELLRNYLNKDHNFRHKQFDLPRRAIVGDYFGVRDGEAFAASGWRNFAPFFTPANVTSLARKGTWIPTLSTNAALWAYGCGAGSYTSIAGVGNANGYHDGVTTELVEHDLKAVFTLLFGSWLGDWDSEDNLLRSVLALPSYGLASAWSGRPHWFLHHMALGETIGYGARLAQNNRPGGLYHNQVNSCAGMVHIALMGDPTLRMHVVAPAGNLGAASTGSGTILSWSPSSDAVAGYHVYHAANPNGPFIRLNSDLVKDTAFVDTNAASSTAYMVRAVKLETSASGTYWNPSQGTFLMPAVDDIRPIASTDNTSTNGSSIHAMTNGPSSLLTTNAEGFPAAANRDGTRAVVAREIHATHEQARPLQRSAINEEVTGANLKPTGATNSSLVHKVVTPKVVTHKVVKSKAVISKAVTSKKKTPPPPKKIVSVPVRRGRSTSVPNAVLWMDDRLPAGAVAGADGGDAWSWVTSNPMPVLGAYANRSRIGRGFQQHYFTSASATLPVNPGENLLAYVYLDPNYRVNEIMLQWNDGSWEHRAYWGANRIAVGADGTVGRRYMGPLPSRAKWMRLEVPASLVGLEGRTISGMSFSQFGGRVAWDCIGKTGTATTNAVSHPWAGATNSFPGVTNSLPGLSLLDYAGLELPEPGASALHILTPTLVELKLVNSKSPSPARVNSWDLVDASGRFAAPPPGAFAVTANGQPLAITGIGFKRRPLYAPFRAYDLRIDNSLYLQLASPIADNQAVEVRNPGASLWPESVRFAATSDPLRFSPAIHVNQEGYMPNYTKKAMVGYYAGSLGEMDVPAASGFTLVDANTGAMVYQGSLVPRPDSGYTYTPAPYQKVYEADFTAFNTPGQYRLLVPGLGGSLPFLLTEGIAMAFARAYALGLYHQRCGEAEGLPTTRFSHDPCHIAPAGIPMPTSSFPFTWNTVSNYSQIINSDNPVQTAPALTGPAALLFPYQRQGTFDASGGHHDAGDYSKYTINSASFIHYLMFAVDSLPGVAALDNLGIPESGDGISDIMQEAKWEADFLAKLQDSDGGFYFLVYPKDREYEAAPPAPGDPQIVWPKTTSVTAAAVAALAQCASSPLFRQTYPDVAATYLQKAQLGWQFLNSAISRYGKTGAYQKITHYGDNFADRDELAWAACQMYLATGDAAAHQKLLSWFDPADPATMHWGWWHLSECYGHAIRSYAFAARSGRVASTSQLDAAFLGKCQTEIANAGDAALHWSGISAYGTSFPDATKRVQAAGWYFSSDQAFDMTVAYQLNAKPEYLTAILANMNYEGGCNPVNVTYITGLGWKRQRDIVSQYALTEPRRLLPPSGIPVGNVTANFGYLSTYGGDLEALCFPSDSAVSAPYPFYDRWGDSWNVTAEFVILNSARSLASLGFLAAQTSFRSQPWHPVSAQIAVPTSVVPVGTPVTLSLQVAGVPLSGARITWEARDEEPCFGPAFSYSPKHNGPQWVEAEAQLPDGRRLFATAQFSANAPNIVWFDDGLPSGAVPGADGGDSWNWVSANPSPQSGALAHQSSLGSGSRQHFFSGATATLDISAGDVLYAYVYLDPANPPSEIMLQWNDGTWEHRAYWGANSLGYGIDGTASRRYLGPLPAAGQWVQLQVPASQVAVEGSTLNGMSFTLYGGRATWDAAGRLSQGSGATRAAN